MVGLPDDFIRTLERAGHIAPVSDERQESSYSNSDLLVLRIAAALRGAGISARRIVQALAGIRTQLPIETGRRPRPPEEAPPRASKERPRGAQEKTQQAEIHFQTALALEDTDLPASRAAYMTALKLHRHHVEARINLGRLLHLDGQLEEAERIYRAARSSHALLSFNLALLLEDMNREDEAVVAYREALALDPSLHDAHFNLSRLHERAQRSRDALRHLLAYRRHVSRLSPHA